MSAPRPPNLVLVVLDCARASSAGHLDGSDGARMPALAALARRGTRFERAVAPGNWTLPSHRSLFTGVYPWVHGLRTFSPRREGVPALAEWLTARGYETALFSEEVHLVAGYGLEDGYAERHGPPVPVEDDRRTLSNRLFGRSSFAYSGPVQRAIRRAPRLAIPLSALNFRQEVAFKARVSGSSMLDRFRAWLGSRSNSRPFHVFVNFVDAHEPYGELVGRPYLGLSSRGFVQVPRYYLLAVPGLRERVPWPAVEAAYRSCLERADAKVGALVRALEVAGELDRTLIVVTSDHGQSFGESGYVYHGCGASESVLRVPLVVAPPTGMSLRPSIGRWTSLCEVASWMKSAALELEPYDEEGIAPVPFPRDPPTGEYVFAEGAPASDPNRSLAGLEDGARWNHRLFAAYRADEKWVFDPAAGELWHFPEVRAFDTLAAERVAGPEATARARTIFPTAVVDGGGGPAEAPPAEGLRPALSDARMRSWGYD